MYLYYVCLHGESHKQIYKYTSIVPRDVLHMRGYYTLTTMSLGFPDTKSAGLIPICS